MDEHAREMKLQGQAIKAFLRDYLDKPKDGQTLNSILAKVGGYYDGDRAYIFEMDQGHTEFNNTFEWCRTGVSAEIDNLQHISLDGLDCWFSAFEEQGEFYISSLSEDFTPNSKTYQILEPQGVDSLMAAPIVVNGAVVGFLGVDNPRKHTGDLLLLSVVASTCYSEIATRRMLDYTHERSQREAEERRRIIQSMSEIYTSVYYIDLATGQFKELSSRSDVRSHIGASGDAQERLNYFCRKMVTPEYTQELLEFVDLSTLERRLAHTRIVSQQYRSALFSSAEGGSAANWGECSFMEGKRTPDGRLGHVIFATQSIHGAKVRELEARQKLREANEELTALLVAEKQHTDIIGALSSVFSALYYIDLEESTFQEIISRDKIHHILGEKGDAGSALKQLVTRLVADAHKPLMNSFLDLNTMDDRLGESPMILQEYIARDGGWTRCGLIPVERDASGKNRTILCTLRGVTTEREEIASQDNLIQALAIPYENIYAVNEDTGEAICYRMGQTMSDRYGRKFAAGNYEKNIGVYIANDVMPEDRQFFERVRTVAGVNLLLADKKTYYFNYRVFRNDLVQYFQCQLVKPNPGRNEFVIAFKNVDDEKKQELAQSEIIEGLGSEYYSVLLVDPERDRVTAYRKEDEDGRAIAAHFSRHGGCWSKGIRSYGEEMVSEESRREFLEKLSLEHIRSDGEDYSLTYAKLTGGGVMYLQIRVAFVRERDGSFVAVVGTRNVDDLIKKERQQEMALQAAFDAAEAASKAKTDFLSNMSHDIRTPMNGIIGMTAIAAAHIDDKERVQDSLQKITKASKHLLSLINEVLDMSKIESGKVDLVEEEFNLSDLIDNLLSMTSSQIEEHRHQLSVNITGVTHEAVVGDSLRIQKIFTNLMGNAVKFTPDGGKISISISERPCNQAKVGCYEFVFEDNGIGMSETFIKQIFEPFSRAEDGRVNKIQGTGLGMPISRNIVRMMGGDIKVESKLGVGSRFTVTMYLKLQDTVEDQCDKFIDLDVLVADDDEMSLESCCGMLNDLGMKAEGVSTGGRAVERVIEQHRLKRDYFACIIDWKMPDMDGITTTRAIRQAVGADVPIIIISAYDWSDIEQEARAAGANAFISKPLFRSRLAKTFRNLVEEEGLAEREAPLAPLEDTDLSGCRVLLVEDNELNAEIATEILKMTGLQVEWAADGVEAVDMVSGCGDGYYDMIFMDIQMPRMNGYDATRAIRAMDRSYCRKIPIVAMTANAFAEDVLAAKTVGMNGHIAKPLDMHVLAKTLHKWLG